MARLVKAELVAEDTLYVTMLSYGKLNTILRDLIAEIEDLTSHSIIPKDRLFKVIFGYGLCGGLSDLAVTSVVIPILGPYCYELALGRYEGVRKCRLLVVKSDDQWHPLGSEVFYSF